MPGRYIFPARNVGQAFAQGLSAGNQVKMANFKIDQVKKAEAEKELYQQTGKQAADGGQYDPMKHAALLEEQGRVDMAQKVKVDALKTRAANFNHMASSLEYFSKMSGTVNDQETMDKFNAGVKQTGMDVALPEKWEGDKTKDFYNNFGVSAKDRFSRLKKQFGPVKDIPGAPGVKGQTNLGTGEVKVIDKPSGSKKSRAQTIKDLVGRGAPKEVAEGLADKTLKIQKSMYGLESVIIDVATGKVHAKLDQEGKFTPEPGGSFDKAPAKGGDKDPLGLFKGSS